MSDKLDRRLGERDSDGTEFEDEGDASKPSVMYEREDTGDGDGR